MSDLISSLDTQNYDLSRAREMQGVRDGLIDYFDKFVKHKWLGMTEMLKTRC